MGELRGYWQAAKDDSARRFNAAMGIDDVHTHGWKYPLNFNQKLGPTLDNYQSAVKNKKQDKITEHRENAKKIIKGYEGQIDTNKGHLKFKVTVVDKKDKNKKKEEEIDTMTILTKALNLIKGKLV